MTQSILLLPQPQKIVFSGDTVKLADGKLIALVAPNPPALYFTAERARQALLQHAGKHWEIIGGMAVPDEQIGLWITLDRAIEQEQGYRLTIAEPHITLQARDAAGAFYGVATLLQLWQQFGAELPALVIDDWPDYPRRGVMLDISRDKVPTMTTLYALVDKLASWKINEFQLYTEHTFAYQRHPEVWVKASPMTAAEIMALDAYCRERYIDLVPNQNSFGHLHRWFEHERYRPLAETEGGFESPWGTHYSIPYSLSPANPASLQLVDELFAELLPNFTSRYFNVGCDETVDLGLGRSRALCETKGKGRVYLEFLREIYCRTQKYNRAMQFWGDIIGHYPDLVAELPKDAVALEWGYEADHDFPGKCVLFAQAGLPFYVCPGTSSWCSIAGRSDNAVANIRSAAENGLKHGAMGLLNTDWGDGGHWQFLPVSYPGFAYGAAVSWALSTNADLNLPAALSAFAFADKADVMGQLLVDLGLAYQQPGINTPNGSLLFWAYYWSPEMPETALIPLIQHIRRAVMDQTGTPAKLRATLQYIDQVMVNLPQARMAVSDADLITLELTLAADMLRHGARRALLMAGDPAVTAQSIAAELTAIQERFTPIWLARNRPGGLADSLKRMRHERVYYE